MPEHFKGPFDGRPLAFAGAVLAILLAAINLRGGLVVVGPLVDDIRAALHFSASQFSLLTTLPLICFGLVSACVPLLTRHITPPLVVVGALLLISAGAFLRIAEPFAIILAGTLLLGAAIALLNVLIPGLVKGYFPHQTGIMTGIYSVTLGAGAGLGVYLAVPLRDAFDNWHAPMLLWGILPLLCLPPWLYLLRVRSSSYQPPRQAEVKLWRNRTAWCLTGFMGLQSLYFYALATWLPKLLLDAGLNDAEAGLGAALLSVTGIPANLLVPVLAARMRDQRPLVWGIALLALCGLSGLMLLPALGTWIWASLIGLSAGASLSLALTLFALRSDGATQATALSAMAQSVGYLIAATGPLLFGALHDISGSWVPAVGLLILCQLMQLGLGLVAGRAGTLGAAKG